MLSKEEIDRIAEEILAGFQAGKEERTSAPKAKKEAPVQMYRCLLAFAVWKRGLVLVVLAVLEQSTDRQGKTFFFLVVDVDDL